MEWNEMESDAEPDAESNAEPEWNSDAVEPPFKINL